MLAPKGIKAQELLNVYQSMYENQVVSYPRTEDKQISEEQFIEMLPYIDDIAKVVGVDPSLLTHRAPRKTHIKSGCAHGANRPGINVPKSLSDLDRYGSCASAIYETLARNYLAMFCEDYEYETQTGHLEKYPSFKGSVSIPKKPGWKSIFQMDAGDDDEEKEVEKELGTVAKPFVYKGFPQKPPTPTTKWLMKQLESHDVGTGATRTSIFSDVTNENTRFPLLIEFRGKLSMTDYGQYSYILLQNTHIGDVAITEQLMSDMRAVAEGSKSSADVLHQVQQLIRDDIQTMQNNVPNLPNTAFQRPGAVVVGKCPKCGRDIVEGTKGFGCVGWKDQDNPCKFTIWKTNGLLQPSNKKITAKMATQLLETGKCEIKGLVSKKGNKYDGIFHLKEDGDLEFELSQTSDEDRKVVGQCPRCGRDVVEGAKGFGCIGYKDEENPCKFVLWKAPALLANSKKSLSAAQASKLLAGEPITIRGLTSKAGKKYDANFTLQDDGQYANLEMSFDDIPKLKKTSSRTPAKRTTKR